MNELFLGKLPKKEDRLGRTLLLSNYTTTDIVIPKIVDYSNGITDWGMMLNNVEGNCTIAGAGHMELSWTCGRTVIPDSEIQKAYVALSGYNPITRKNDNGCNMLDVQNYWHNTGIGGHKTGAFAEVGLNEKSIKTGLYMFNGLDIGIQLPVSAIDQFRKGKTWKYVRGSRIEGGHCVILTYYDDKYYKLVTWAKEVLVEKKFIYEYMDEGYVDISEDYIIGGKTKQGFDMPTLIQDLKLIA
jgi:hypothetical protein